MIWIEIWELYGVICSERSRWILMVRGDSDGHRLRKCVCRNPEMHCLYSSYTGEHKALGKWAAWFAVLLPPRTCNLFNRPENAPSYFIFNRVWIYILFVYLISRTSWQVITTSLPSPGILHPTRLFTPSLLPCLHLQHKTTPTRRLPPSDHFYMCLKVNRAAFLVWGVDLLTLTLLYSAS